MERFSNLFSRVAPAGACTVSGLREAILASGIQPDDIRLRQTWQALDGQSDRPLDLEAFRSIVGPELLMVDRVLNRKLVIPEWEDFEQDIRFIYDRVAEDRSGANADYIPILRDADPERWGVAVCTVDGQRMALGDVDAYHSIQSVSKPLTYAWALHREGPEFTHRFVGGEPSGRPFNDLNLLPDQRPYNPCVNAGAIMTAGVVASGFPDLDFREINEQLMDLWGEMSGNCAPVRLSEETRISERDCADNNFAIAYLLQGRRGLPRDVDLHKMLDLYFSCCSIEMTARMLSVAAATLANGGVCPINGHKVLSTEIVKQTLSVMQTSGMYDNSGVFTAEVGLPAKSGVGGAVLVVVPNLLGFATFSPRLDPWGNSVRGVGFCRQLVANFSLHVYDNLSGGHAGCKRDPRVSRKERKRGDLSDLRWGIANGDRSALRVRDLILCCMVDIGLADGDLEASELAAMEEVYADLVGEAAPPGALEELARSRAGASLEQGAGTDGPFERLIAELEEHSTMIDDQARQIVFETAFRVACADGVIEEHEEDELRAIAGALGIHEGVVELEIDTFRREHAVS